MNILNPDNIGGHGTGWRIRGDRGVSVGGGGGGGGRPPGGGFFFFL